MMRNFYHTTTGGGAHHQMVMVLWDSTARGLAGMVRQMALDDALIFRRKRRLEYVRLANGYDHYRLYEDGRLIWQADVMHARQLRLVQDRVALWLAATGWHPAGVTHRVYGARTDVLAKTSRSLRLMDACGGVMIGRYMRGRRAG